MLAKGLPGAIRDWKPTTKDCLGYPGLILLLLKTINTILMLRKRNYSELSPRHKTSEVYKQLMMCQRNAYLILDAVVSAKSIGAFPNQDQTGSCCGSLYALCLVNAGVRPNFTRSS